MKTNSGSTNLRRTLLSLAVAQALLLVATGARDALAQANVSCAGSPSADCADVAAGGIRYTSGVSTVNVGDGVPGSTLVNPGTVGIALSRSGVSGAAAPDVEFQTLQWDTDGNTQTDKVAVVSRDGTTPHQVDGNFILVVGYDTEGNANAFAIGAQTYTGLQLVEFLAANSSDTGAAISGSLTVNNNAGALSQGAPFSTTNAVAIAASSTGGNGGSGGCGTILVYSWCDDGYRGGNAGSVAVNSNSKITVNGDSPEQHGIVAVSRGGNGGNGGGWFGLFASTPGGGGDGGNGGAVFVTLGSASDITTHGDRSHGVFAQSRGGDGGSGGHASGLVALGDDGGNGGDAGNVVVENRGAILTTGWNSHGILARSVGAGAGSGSSSGGAYAEGGNGGGESSGAAVTVNNSGSIHTEKADAFGILAQSIGGGGGDGGGAGGWFTVGGRAGSGGGSGVVSVFDSGKVQTGGHRSTAIFAQSVGGGGGNGGDAVSISQTVSVAVGGAGGLGGAGNEVRVIAEGSDIDTAGDSAHGIHAQSFGGGGGNGGVAVSGTRPGNAPFNISVALGGNGGGGGNAGALVDVQARSGTTIDTAGAASHGILAKSIGGGGGNGATAFAASGGPGLSVAVAIGGKGGVAGEGKAVNVENRAAITTTGALSAGIFTQSIGGGGGNGGFAGSLAIGGSSASVSLGGTGAAGGQAGRVDVDNFGTIDTSGAGAAGVFAQSVGGGGGNGGSALAGSIGLASVATTVGGRGGAGNFGGVVDILNAGVITTRGNNSAGVFAQSVGGGGGSGGDATSLALAGPVAVAVAVGGSGGSGGNGGNVLVRNEGRIEAQGPNSDGVFAQSIGGSGGSGGSATSGTLVFPIEIEGVEIPAISANVSVGGRGAGGGTAGEVGVTNSGAIVTTGFLSNGVFAQSIGGSGGKGGHATNISLAFDATFTGKVAVGGSGGQGGTGNRVSVGSSGLISTQGHFSNGVFAQSVGGGGGTGGNATNVSLSLTPPPTSPEDFIPSPSANFDLAFGGNGGSGAIGGQVDIVNSGKIATRGNFSAGVMAQSVGGSGGFGGDARTIQVELTADPMDFVPLTGLTSLDLTLVVGGTGGSGSHGGVVTVTNKGEVATTGAFAHGIVAQSVGGGGGAGGSAMTFEFSNADVVPEIPVLDDIGGLTTLSMTLQGSGGAGGDGRLVTVESLGSIKTTGHFAMGIVGQSVAGGGGLSGFYNPHGITGNEIADSLFNTFVQTEAGLSFAGSVGGAGTAGDVSVKHTGTIETAGHGAHGIFAQSAAGQGRAGNVLVELDGAIRASGKDAHGIYAQSGGASGNGNITIEIKTGGTVQGGIGTGAGVRLAGGASNSLTNRGTISALSGTAILGGNSADAIHNFGTVTGSVNLGAGGNAFNNNAGAAFNAGPIVALGTGASSGTLTNRGTLSPAGAGVVGVTALTGNLGQPDGTLAIDLDRKSQRADRLDVSGSASFGGRLVLSEMNAAAARPGTRSYTVLSAAGGAQNSGVSLVAPRSAVSDYQLAFSNANEVVVTVATDFSSPRHRGALSGNQRALGEGVNAVQMAGGSDALAPLVARLIEIEDPAELKAAYDHVSPEPHAGALGAAANSSARFSQALLSCRVRDGEYRFVREGECSWFRMLGRETTRHRTAANPGFHEDAAEVSGGLQKQISRDWLAGIGLAYESSSLKTEDFSKSSGHRGQAGLMFKTLRGAASASLGLSAGGGRYDSRRAPAPGVVASATQDITFAAAHVRLGYMFERKSWYVQPTVDLGSTWVRLAGFRETGAGGLGLDVQKQTEQYGTIQPALELGGEIALSSGTLVRPFGSIGATRYLSGTNPRVTAQFQGAPAGVAPFTVTGAIDKNYLDLVAGVDLLSRSGKDLRLVYTGQFGKETQTRAIALKLSIPF